MSTEPDFSVYRRWEDPGGVVHWVESQRGARLFTSCNSEVKTSGNFAGYPSYESTKSVPSCIRCVVEALDDVYAR